MNIITVNINVQVSWWYADSGCFGCVPKSGIAKSFDDTSFNYFWETSMLVSVVTVQSHRQCVPLHSHIFTSMYRWFLGILTRVRYNFGLVCMWWGCCGPVHVEARGQASSVFPSSLNPPPTFFILWHRVSLNLGLAKSARLISQGSPWAPPVYFATLGFSAWTQLFSVDIQTQGLGLVQLGALPVEPSPRIYVEFLVAFSRMFWKTNKNKK